MCTNCLCCVVHCLSVCRALGLACAMHAWPYACGTAVPALGDTVNVSGNVSSPCSEKLAEGAEASAPVDLHAWQTDTCMHG